MNLSKIHVNILLIIPATVFTFDIILGPLPCFPGQCDGSTPPVLSYSNEDGDGVVDVVLTGDKDSDILASIEILKNIVGGLGISKGLEKHIQKNLKKAVKELRRGKTEKAVKHLNKIIKKLKKEIGKDYHSDNENHKNHKEGKNHHEDNKQKISTKDAQRLIFMIEQIKKTVL